MDLNIFFLFFEIWTLSSIWVSIKIEKKFEFMEFDCDVKEKWIVEIFQRRQHDYRLIDGCFHKDFKVFVEATIYKPIIMLTPLKNFNNPFSNNLFSLPKSHRSKKKSLNKIRHNTKQTSNNQTKALWKKLLLKETETFIFWWCTVITQ